MMHFDPTKASLWEYQAVLWHWNERHTPDDKPDAEQVEAPDAEFVAHRRAVMMQRGFATGVLH